MMHPTVIYILLAIIAALVVFCFKLAFDTQGYRTIIKHLTKSIKNMYCKEAKCDNIRYSTIPVDSKKGFITDYCIVHLPDHAEGTLESNAL